jgi:hypothetical protein
VSHRYRIQSLLSVKEEEIPNWTVRHQAIRDLIELVGQNIPYLTSRPDLRSRHLAACSLARCRVLLIGLDRLIEADLGEVAGVLLRSLYETWLTGSYVLLEGDASVDPLLNEYKRRIDQLVRMGHFDISGDWTFEGTVLTVEAMARKYGQLLAQKGDPRPEFPSDAYEILYRPESLLNSHGGVGAMIGYMSAGNGWLGVKASRAESDGGKGKLIMGAAFAALLAREVFDTFGLGTAILDSAFSPLHEGLIAQTADR